MFHVFLERKACFEHYAQYTFSKRFGWNKILANIAGFIMSLFVPALLKSGRGLPVYRGSRKVMDTFQESVKALKNGENLLIFPDVEYSDKSGTVKQLHEGFLFIEKYYYKETGKHIHFVPLYVSRNQKRIVEGNPISFHGKAKFATERKQVLQNIQDSLNLLAKQCGDD